MAVMRTACLLNLLVLDQRAHDTKTKARQCRAFVPQALMRHIRRNQTILLISSNTGIKRFY